ncbi:hypothetical protein AMR42_14420 [Limnothrix sp. PR1529]|uniref:DNA adenine methylase n=1 Tax=Limnothrix sp. PR1529 TaxID=1704291 RepID=UPI00081D37E8|nr:DNA adenine methylase [Limnothrix sp. PR1529]OCQ94022.1 hypothetical protein BCR12_05770 [Limnothrix sp. P13C2]PIB07315.1 hypothetical protein AMR42_14420 [Limnothrix sp. PR1529]
MATLSILKPIFRYPGGKSREAGNLVKILGIPSGYFVDLFGGGGSLSLAAFSGGGRVWINDLHTGPFWVSAVSNHVQLLSLCEYWLRQLDSGVPVAAILSALERPESDPVIEGARIWVRNRLTVGGVIDGAGPSDGSRFNQNAINRLRSALGAIHVDRARFNASQQDYADVLPHLTARDALFLDPPYESAAKSKLYGFRGELHTAYRHEQLRTHLDRVPCRWLMTCENTDQTRTLFADFYQRPWGKTYGMTGGLSGSRSKGSELLVANFDLTGVAL